MTFPARLKKIIKYSGLKKKDFTDLCDISKNQLYNYLKHDQLPNTKVFQSINNNFPEINLNWLINGAGAMLAEKPPKEPKEKPPRPTKPPDLKPEGNLQPTEGASENIRISEALTMTAQVLESGTSYATALYLNIQHFGRAIRAEKEIVQIRKDMREIKDDKTTVETRLGDLEQKIQDMQNQAEQEKEAEKKSA